MDKPFKLVLADMILFVATDKFPSPVRTMGYSTIVKNVQDKLQQATSLIPKVFDGVDVTFTPPSFRPTIKDTDGLVYLITDADRSLLGKAGAAKALANMKVLGMTQLGAPTVICEVYFNRCVNIEEVSKAIIHELAHAKSNLGDPMHDHQKGIFAADGGGNRFLPEDAKWLSQKLANKVAFNSTLLGSPGGADLKL